MKPILILYQKLSGWVWGGMGSLEKFDDKAEYLAIEHSAPGA